jgi:hypothetical protein
MTSHVWVFALSVIVVIAGITWISIEASIFPEQNVHDWFDFRKGAATCSLLNQTAVPFRYVAFSDCSGCNAPSGNTGTLGGSCSAYENAHRTTSPYANGGSAAGFSGGLVCNQGTTECCREECDTCRRCTGSGDSKSCHSEKCNCRCLDSRDVYCRIDAATQYEARIGVWVNDLVKFPTVRDSIPSQRGFFLQDLVTKEDFQANPVPYGRVGFATEGAARGSALLTSAVNASAIAAATQLTLRRAQQNCFVSPVYNPSTAFATNKPYYGPGDKLTSPAEHSYNPTTILLTDASLRTRYLKPGSSVSSQNGPPVPWDETQVVSKGDVRFAFELQPIPDNFWVLFVVPGFMIAIGFCFCATFISRVVCDKRSEEMDDDDRRLCWCFLWYTGHGMAEKVFGCCGIIVIPTCAFVPLFTSVRGLDELPERDSVLAGLLVAWIVINLIIVANIVPKHPPAFLNNLTRRTIARPTHITTLSPSKPAHIVKEDDDEPKKPFGAPAPTAYPVAAVPPSYPADSAPEPHAEVPPYPTSEAVALPPGAVGIPTLLAGGVAPPPSSQPVYPPAGTDFPGVSQPSKDFEL